MRKSIIYVFFVVLSVMTSCQKDELREQDPVQGTEVGNEATITFSAMLPSNTNTKAMGDNPDDEIESMHLVVFDGNGMYVETREAQIIKNTSTDHTTDKTDNEENPIVHHYETKFKVTLTVTDQPRIIHFIANCPVEQIVYGHEASIIGNMYTTKSNYTEDDKTLRETAFWARVKVPYILVEEINEGAYRPVQGIIGSFKCVPMLRNYAQVVVKDGTNTTDKFEFIGFTLYNTIDKGTVAPYNNMTQQFQSFLDPSTGSGYKYPRLNYKGHALAAAELNTSLEWDNNTNDYKWYNDKNPFYMYERKISVKTDEEDKWSESPPHLIIKGKYNGKICYYKVDLVYNVYGSSGQVTDIVYYNILRNFRYQFTITAVSGEGYSTVEDAVRGATSNNLSGSSTTSKFTNISDKVGRIWVSYTDTTLVSNHTITFKYKYEPNISDNQQADYEVVRNDLISIDGINSGEVIAGYQVSSNNISGGKWDGYREVTMTIKNPDDMTKEQTVVLRTDNANLTRNIRFYLKDKYNLEVECTPKVAAKIGAPVEVDIKLPIGLTEDMFPLDLDIEVYDLTLSPDASRNSIPVVTGPSTIGRKNGVPTFHYVKSIETKAEYDAIPTVGIQKTIKTYWLTNIAANESTVYVSNKYFEEASDNFVNATSLNGRFSKGSIGVTDNLTVEYLFEVPSIDDQPVFTVTLSRLRPIDSGSGLEPTDQSGVYTYTPQSAGTQRIKLQATENVEGICTISIISDDAFGYEDVSNTIPQIDATTYYGNDKTVRFTYVDRPSGSTSNTYTAKINKIEVDGAEVTYDGTATYTYSNWNSGTLTISLSSIYITGADINNNTEIKITSTITRGTNATSQVTRTTTIGGLKLSKQ